MTRWALAAAALLIVAGVATVALARLFGKSGSRVSIGVSVIAHWLAAYVLWNFAGGLAAHYRWLDWHDGGAFALLAIAGGIWQYRAHVRQGRERGLAVFVAGQLVWLAVLLVRNGALAR